MTDLIDRAALKIDTWERLSDAVCALEKAPSVDAVEVVKCGECKSFGLHHHKRYGFCSHPHGLMSPKPDQFCSYGERRTDETD